MDRTSKILIGILAVGAIAGTGYYFFVIRKRATLAQYNEFRDAAKALKMDIESGMNLVQIGTRKEAWQKNLTRVEADRLITLAKENMGVESDAPANVEMSPEAAELIQKWTGKTL